MSVALMWTEEKDIAAIYLVLNIIKMGELSKERKNMGVY